MTNNSTALALVVSLILAGSAAMAQEYRGFAENSGFYGSDQGNIGPGVAPADRHLNANGNWGYYVRGGHFEPPRGFSDVSGPNGVPTYIMEPGAFGRTMASAMNSHEVMQIRRRQALQVRQHHRALQVRGDYRYR